MVWNQMCSCVFSSFFIHYIQSNHYNLSLNTIQFVVFSSFFSAFLQCGSTDFLQRLNKKCLFNRLCCELRLQVGTSNIHVKLGLCYKCLFSSKIGQTCWKLKFVNFFLSADEICCRLCHKHYFQLPSKHVWIVANLTKTIKLLRFFFRYKFRMFFANKFRMFFANQFRNFFNKTKEKIRFQVNFIEKRSNRAKNRD